MEMIQIDIEMIKSCSECPFNEGNMCRLMPSVPAWQKEINECHDRLAEHCPLKNYVEEYNSDRTTELTKDELLSLKKYYINLYDLLGALIEYGQHDKQFKLGDTIKYDPVSVVKIAKEFLDR